MKNLLLLCAMLFCGIAVHAQNKDQQMIVTVVNAALTGKNPAVLPLLLAPDVSIYVDSLLYESPNEKQREIYCKSQKQYTNPKIRSVIDIDKAKLVNNDNLASMFCIVRLFEGNSNDPIKTVIHSLILEKNGTAWKIKLWQQSTYKYDVAGEWE
jgi:hypothetical protein